MSEFVTKDSGERKQFASGMQRDTEGGKTLFHLVYEGPLFKRWAELLTRGAAKYDESNWLKASGPDELKRFKASAARHFAQWFYDETDEDHAAAVLFNINGAEYVKGKIKVENEARINKVNKAQPEEVIIPDRLHAALTQDAFIQNRPYYDETYTTAEDKNYGPGLNLDSLVKLQDEIKDRILFNSGQLNVGIDLAHDDADRIVYLVGEPGKQVFVVPEELRAEFEKVTLARNNETVPVNEDTLNLLRFNGFPLVYTPNLGASPLDRKQASDWRFVFDRYQIEPWPDFGDSCSGDEPFNFFQRLLIKLQDLYQDVKSLVAKKLYAVAVDLDPEVTYEDVEA